MSARRIVLVLLLALQKSAFSLESGYDPRAGREDGLHILDLRHAADIAPASAKAHNDLGIACSQQGKPYDAIAEFETAYRLAPDDAAIAFNAGVAHARAKNYTEALTYLNRSLSLCPDNAAALFNMGIIHLDMGMPGAAAGELERALLLDPDHPLIHYNLAVACEYDGEGVRYGPGFPAEKALQHYRIAAEKGLDNVAVRYNMGIVSSKLGDYEAAESNLARAVDLDPGFVPARRDLALALLEEGRYHRALRELERAMAVSDDASLSRAAARVHRRLGSFYLENGDYRRAMVQFEKALQHDEDDASAHLEMAMIDTVLGRYGSALRSLRRAGELDETLELDEELAKVHFLRGAEFEERGRYRAALAEYRKAARTRGDFALANLAAGELCCEKLGMREEAGEYLRRCVELEPEGPYSKRAEELLGRLSGRPHERE